MFDTLTTTPAFTIGQLETLLAWSAGRPRGFRHVLAQGYDQAIEVAEMTQREVYDHLYRIRPALNGRVELEARHGGEVWELDTIEDALAELLAIEVELEAEWVASTEQAGAGPAR